MTSLQFLEHWQVTDVSPNLGNSLCVSGLIDTISYLWSCKVLWVKVPSPFSLEKGVFSSTTILFFSSLLMAVII